LLTIFFFAIKTIIVSVDFAGKSIKKIVKKLVKQKLLNDEFFSKKDEFFIRLLLN